ncbi:hypothetical protein, partial [Shouchella clausii]|uniref:hypothetical protein n=2 Tax=Shouchella clausii TaxID=79880 RepID=UPI000BD1AEBD
VTLVSITQLIKDLHKPFRCFVLTLCLFVIRLIDSLSISKKRGDFMDIFSAVAPVITGAAFAVSAIAFTYAKTQDEKIKSLEQRNEQLEKNNCFLPFGY